jgi:hypothetical protein
MCVTPNPNPCRTPSQAAWRRQRGLTYQRRRCLRRSLQPRMSGATHSAQPCSPAAVLISCHASDNTSSWIHEGYK